jgi:DNA-binding CsgD family transcriptional regulator
MRDRPAERATDREVVVVAAVLLAGSEKAAAHRLGLSHSTVKHHLANARSKVGAETTAQLVWILAPRLPEPEGVILPDRGGLLDEVPALSGLLEPVAERRGAVVNSAGAGPPARDLVAPAVLVGPHCGCSSAARSGSWRPFRATTALRRYERRISRVAEGAPSFATGGSDARRGR